MQIVAQQLWSFDPPRTVADPAEDSPYGTLVLRCFMLLRRIANGLGSALEACCSGRLVYTHVFQHAVKTPTPSAFIPLRLQPQTRLLNALPEASLTPPPTNYLCNKHIGRSSLVKGVRIQ